MIRYKDFECDTVEEAVALMRAIGDVSNDGWITWNGGSCPVPGDTLVTVIDRDDEVYKKILAGNLRWEWNDNGGDIVKYRVVS